MFNESQIHKSQVQKSQVQKSQVQKDQTQQPSSKVQVRICKGKNVAPTQEKMM